MKTRLIALAVAAVVGISANADVLYWQVADNAQSEGYAAAYLMAKDTDGKLYYFNENVTQSGAAVGAVGAAAPQVFANGGYAAATFEVSKLLSWDTDTAYAGTGDLTTMSFYVELWNTANDFSPSSYKGRTLDMTYSQVESLVKSGFDPSFTGVNGALGSAAKSTYTSEVPEPTSGLLMLVGLGALALRRRRA